MSIKFASATSLKKGSYIIMDGEPCRVSSVATSKPGKHGAAKSRVEGIGIIDDKKRTLLVPGGDEVEVPIIEKRNAQVLSVTGSKVSLMDAETYETLELEIPSELEGQLSEGNTVVYWQVMHYKILKQLKQE
jgi:translation initiation factor 5A